MRISQFFKMKKINIDNQYLKLTLFSFAGFIIGLAVHLVINHFMNLEHSIEWNGGVYYGEETGGIPNGDGRFEKDGNIYSGSWTNGELASGVIETLAFKYEGDLDEMKPDGYGTCIYKDGTKYTGYWSNNKKEGLGIQKSKDGNLEFGTFKNNELVIDEDFSFKFGDLVYGIDVSKHQGVINWQDCYMTCDYEGKVNGKLNKKSKLKQPVLFALIKSTQGTSLRDERFTSNFPEAKRCGMIRGAYHFLTMNVGGKEQAEYFISNTPLEAGDFPPILDLEKNTAEEKIVSDNEFAKIIPIAKEWIDVVKKHYNVKPIIYTNTHIYKKFVSIDPELRKYDIWIAYPGSKKPEVANSIIWQFSHFGRVNGIPDSPVDLNIFDGNYKDLLKYIKQNGIKESNTKHDE